MSTHYYKLKQPLTSVRILNDESPTHKQISIWIKHGLAGILTIPIDLISHFLFCLYDQDGEVVYTSWGGKEKGSQVNFIGDSRYLPDDMTLISEYGEVYTLKEVKAKQGAKRSDGMPTELFGYEEKK